MKLVLAYVLALLCFIPAAAMAAGGVEDPAQLTIVSQDGKRHDFKIELALTSAQQEKGLMNRTEMAPDAGMLFLFKGEAERSFWMKNTLIPLDMIFIRKDGTIHHIHDSAKPLDLTGVSSNGPVMAVLELNGGTAKRLKIVPGDNVDHIFFRK